MLHLKQIIFLLLLLFIQRQQSSASAAATCKPSNSSGYIPGQMVLFCYEFSSWSELNAFPFKSLHSLFLFFFLQPSSPLLLTQDLNVPILQSVSRTTNPRILLYSLAGLNVYPWPAGVNQQLSLDIYLTKIDFYVNGLPPTHYACTPDLIPTNHSTTTTLFSSFFSGGALLLKASNRYSNSHTPVCPFLFKQAQLADFELLGQVQSFLYVNLLRFSQQHNYSDNSVVSSSIGSAIQSVLIHGYNYPVDAGLLQPLVFETVNSLSLYNKVAFIQTDLFKYFEHLGQLVIHVEHVGDFYHKVGIQWMAYLPPIGVQVDIACGLYTYPDHIDQNTDIKFVINYDNPV
jgi:hypothetical protein